MSLSALWASAQTVKVSAPNLVSATEQFRVTFTVEGDSKVSDFTWSPGSDFQLVWGPTKSFSSNTSIVNGKVTSSSSSSYSYLLLPLGTGKFTLGAATATFKGGQSAQSRPFTIEVVADNSQASSQGSGQQQSQGGSSQGGSSQGAVTSGGKTSGKGSDVFMSFSLSSKNLVVGQPVTATIKLYQRAEITGFDDAKFPSFTGFWSQDISPQGNVVFQRENVDNVIYNAAVLKQYVLIPQQSGDIVIEGSTLDCIVRYRNSSGGGLFDDFFDNSTSVRKRVTTPSMTVHVSKLPSGAPASFRGGVGKFTMTAKVSKDSLYTHEASSIVVTVSGSGNIALVEPPVLNFPSELEVYDTKTTENIDRARGGVSGSKTYEYPFIPRSYGDFVLPPVQYSYYDTESGKYVTTQSDSLRIHVLKGADDDTPAATVTMPVVTKRGVKNLSEDIRFIAAKPGNLSPKGRFFVFSAAFWIIAAVLVLLFAAIWIALSSIAARKADVVGTKTRKATQMAMKRLRLAQNYLKQGIGAAFYEELYRAMLGFVSDKLNMPAADLSKERISECLSAGGVSEEAISKLIDVLDACEFARYAPAGSNEQMTAHYDMAVEAISTIDSVMKKSKNTAVRSILILLVAMSAFSFNAQASQSVDSLWTKAAAAYSEGQWSEAVASYQAILDKGVESPKLYYNLAGAYFKDGWKGKAVLNYERALRLDPSFNDAKYNLEIVNAQIEDDIAQVPEFILKSAARKLCYMISSDAWAVIALLMLALTLAGVLMFVLCHGSALRKTGFFGAIAAVLLFVCALGCSLSQRSDALRQDKAVIIKPVAPAKSSPSAESSADLFVLHEGTKVTIIDEVAAWVDVELADGRQGWVKKDTLEII